MTALRRAALAATLLASTAAAALTMNGFEIGPDALVPANRIHAGGPPRDGIPAITAPKFEPGRTSREVAADEWVLGIAWNGVTKAYPIAIMNYHEIVNDRFGGEPVIVTFCPLCGSGIAYSARVDGRVLHFGVSGLLYNSDVLLYDRETGSLWSQMLSQAVTGPLKGSRLEMLPLVQTPWSAWLAQHPDTLVLSRDTGYERDYDRDPYSGYQDSSGVWFPVTRKDPRYHPKERVIGIGIDGRFKAYPMAELSRAGNRFRDRFAGRELEVRIDGPGQVRFFLDDGSELPGIPSYWFAWYAFHPDTEVFQAD